MLAVSSWIGLCSRTAKQHRQIALASVAERMEDWCPRVLGTRAHQGRWLCEPSIAAELETQREERKEQYPWRGQHAHEARFQMQRTKMTHGTGTPGSVRQTSHEIRAKIPVRCTGNTKGTSRRSLWEQSAGSSLKNGLEGVQMGGRRTKREIMGSLVYFSS